MRRWWARALGVWISRSFLQQADLAEDALSEAAAAEAAARRTIERPGIVNAANLLRAGVEGADVAVAAFDQ